MSLRGNTAPPDGCPRERSTAPAGCAAESRMTIPEFGISGRPWMPPSSCWKSSNFSHEKTLPGRDRQTPASPGQEAFLTPYLTTVRTGTRGNSGFKSVKKHSILSRKCWKALQITTKNLVQAFGTIRLGVRLSHLGPSEYLSRFSNFLLLICKFSYVVTRKCITFFACEPVCERTLFLISYRRAIPKTHCWYSRGTGATDICAAFCGARRPSTV